MTPQEIEQIIDMLVEKLGPIGGEVWGIYLKQVYISVVYDVSIALLLIVGGIAGLVIAWHIYKRVLPNVGSYSYWELGMYFGFGCGLASLILGLLLSTNLVRLLNPEYYALQMLLGR